MGRSGPVAVPGVDLCLQVVALGEQSTVLGCELVDDLVGAGPERVRVHSGAGECLIVDEVVEHLAI